MESLFSSLEREIRSSISSFKAIMRVSYLWMASSSAYRIWSCSVTLYSDVAISSICRDLMRVSCSIILSFCNCRNLMRLSFSVTMDSIS